MSEGVLLVFLSVLWVGFGIWYFRERKPWSGIPLFLSMMTVMTIASIVTKGFLNG